jgi:hypothetical protein
MVGLVVLMIRLTIKLTILSAYFAVWAMIVMIALPMSIVASARGNERSAREWQHAMRWRGPRSI